MNVITIAEIAGAGIAFFDTERPGRGLEPLATHPRFVSHARGSARSGHGEREVAK
jgi:hypothetical protein